MRTFPKLLTLILALAATGASAQNLADLPSYHADKMIPGELRIWGNEYMTELVQRWEVEFHKHHKLTQYDTGLGSGIIGIGALYTGVADLCLMAHTIFPQEIEGFRQVFGYEPLDIVVATGAYDVDGAMPSIVIFVNRQNPLSRLTLPQLDRIMSEHRTGGWRGTEWSTASARSEAENIRTWGQLGLTGEWAGKEIHVYGYDLTLNSFQNSMQRMVFEGGDKWNPDLVEFPLTERRPGALVKGGAYAVIDAISKDPQGIGYTNIQYSRNAPEVKPLALAAREGGPYVEYTRENCINRTYPLVESVHVYINRAPGKPVGPKLKEFLKYILSREGQQQVMAEGSYLPLTAEAVAAERKKLE